MAHSMDLMPTPFLRSLRSLAVHFELEHELADLTAGDAFARLHKLSEDPNFALKLQAYGEGEVARFKFEAKDVNDSSPINESVEDLIFAQLVRSMAFRYTGTTTPKLHHWMPVTYLKNFARGKNRKKQNPSVHKISWASGKGKATAVSNKYFAHAPSSEGVGFYHLAMEYFFSRLEQNFAEQFRTAGAKPERKYSFAAYAAFFVVQSVRNPHPDLGFTVNSIEGVVDALAAQLAALPPVTASVAEASKHLPLPITPYTPPRLRKLADGSSAFVFAISFRCALVLSTRPLSSEEQATAVEANRHAVLTHARRTGGEIFGLYRSDFPNN